MLGTSLLDDATAIGLFLQDTSQLNRLVHSYREHCRNRGRTPVPVFSGPLAPVVGDNPISDLANRHRCDLVLLHGERQLQEAAAMRFNWPPIFRTNLGERRLLVHAGTPGPWPPQRWADIASVQPSGTGTTEILFRREPNPSCCDGRSGLPRSPQWNVVIQRDHAWSDDAAWIADETHEARTPPMNLGFGEPGQLFTLLSSCTACASVSSPWLVTAMAWGRQTMVIGDFGIHLDRDEWLLRQRAMHRLRSITHLDQLLELPRHSHRWLSMGWDVHDGGNGCRRPWRSSPMTHPSGCC